MRRFARVLSVAVLTASLATAAMAGPVRVGYRGPLPDQLNAGYRQTLASLRRDALRQQAADGGTLTAEHRLAFQQHLDSVNAFHRRTLANHNPLTVDANGTPAALPDPTAGWTWSRIARTGAPG